MPLFYAIFSVLYIRAGPKSLKEELLLSLRKVLKERNKKRAPPLKLNNNRLKQWVKKGRPAVSQPGRPDQNRAKWIDIRQDKTDPLKRIHINYVCTYYLRLICTFRPESWYYSILIDEEHTPTLRIIIINRVSSIGCVECLNEKNCKK